MCFLCDLVLFERENSYVLEPQSLSVLSTIFRSVCKLFKQASSEYKQTLDIPEAYFAKYCLLPQAGAYSTILVNELKNNILIALYHKCLI